jgi:hypothetical protein
MKKRLAALYQNTRTHIPEDEIFISIALRIASLEISAICVGFLEYRLALEPVFPWELQISLVNIILQMLRTLQFIFHRRYTTLATDSLLKPHIWD